MSGGFFYTRVFTAPQPPFLLRGGGATGNEASRDGAAHGRRGQVARVLVGEHAARGVAGREQAGDGLLVLVKHARVGVDGEAAYRDEEFVMTA